MPTPCFGDKSRPPLSPGAGGLRWQEGAFDKLQLFVREKVRVTILASVSHDVHFKPFESALERNGNLCILLKQLELFKTFGFGAKAVAIGAMKLMLQLLDHQGLRLHLCRQKRH